ncbi:MAG: helix-turn-helix domain-containing protein, partial [Terracidiphilus sp.]
GNVVSKTELTEHIYGLDADRDSNVIEVLIKRLRNKIGADIIQPRFGGCPFRRTGENHANSRA